MLVRATSFDDIYVALARFVRFLMHYRLNALIQYLTVLSFSFVFYNNGGE